MYFLFNNTNNNDAHTQKTHKTPITINPLKTNNNDIIHTHTHTQS